jgi:uncharacterized DUF497 family protein
LAGSVDALRPNHSVKLTRYGRLCKPGPRYGGDPDSFGEQRFVALGMSAAGALLVVVYTHREPDIYRLISAWKANKPPRKLYEKGRR